VADDFCSSMTHSGAIAAVFRLSMWMGWKRRKFRVNWREEVKLRAENNWANDKHKGIVRTCAEDGTHNLYLWNKAGTYQRSNYKRNKGLNEEKKLSHKLHIKSFYFFL
jgi:hypothetical protein